MTTARESDPRAYEQVFLENYRREYGFELVGRSILVDDIRVRAIGRSATSLSLQELNASSASALTPVAASPAERVSVYFQEGVCETPVFHLQNLLGGVVLNGPAIIMQNVATVVIEPGIVRNTLHRFMNLL